MPTVSVIIPVYNVAGYVESCIAAVAAQTQPPLEVLLVDDRGQDNSVALAERALRHHQLTWRTIVQPGNRGLGAARNLGLDQAAGELVWFLDSDDRADPRFMETMTLALANERAQAAVCRTMRVTGDDTDLDIDESAYDSMSVSGPDFAKGMLRNRFRAYAGNKLFRRAELPAGMFDEGRAYEDFRPVLRFALNCDRIALVNDPLYRYTRNAASISAQFGAHTADLFGVADDVAAALDAAGRLPDWSRDLALYRALNVVLPVANMALRAEHVRGADPATTAAVSDARRRVALRDLWSLLAGRHRAALSLSVLKVSPALYSRMLKSR